MKIFCLRNIGDYRKVSRVTKACRGKIVREIDLMYVIKCCACELFNLNESEVLGENHDDPKDTLNLSWPLDSEEIVGLTSVFVKTIDANYFVKRVALELDRDNISHVLVIYANDTTYSKNLEEYIKLVGGTMVNS